MLNSNCARNTIVRRPPSCLCPQRLPTTQVVVSLPHRDGGSLRLRAADLQSLKGAGCRLVDELVDEDEEDVRLLPKAVPAVSSGRALPLRFLVRLRPVNQTIVALISRRPGKAPA